MDTVVVLANGGRASARDLYFMSTVSDFATSQAKVSQNYIFGGTPYTGTYEVTPTAHEQYLDTSQKFLRDDVTVHKVPYYETTNESGGYTVSILS